MLFPFFEDIHYIFVKIKWNFLAGKNLTNEKIYRLNVSTNSMM